MTTLFNPRQWQLHSAVDDTSLFLEGANDNLIQSPTMTASFSSRRYQPFTEGNKESLIHRLTMTASFRGRIFQSSQKATMKALFSGWHWEPNIEAKNTSLFRRPQWQPYSPTDKGSPIQQPTLLAFLRRRQWKPYSVTDNYSHIQQIMIPTLLEGDNESLVQRLTITAIFIDHDTIIFQNVRATAYSSTYTVLRKFWKKAALNRRQCVTFFTTNNESLANSILYVLEPVKRYNKRHYITSKIEKCTSGILCIKSYHWK
jgi:hypothetical protein